MAIVHLPHGNQSLNTADLIAHMGSRDFIIQGQCECIFSQHEKPNSLDYYLRASIGPCDTKQATNEVIESLVATGLFVEGKFTCPDSGKQCKGIQLID